MADVLFVVLLVALFAMTVGVVGVCDRMIGADEEVATAPIIEEPERVAA